MRFVMVIEEPSIGLRPDRGDETGDSRVGTMVECGQEVEQ